MMDDFWTFSDSQDKFPVCDMLCSPTTWVGGERACVSSPHYICYTTTCAYVCCTTSYHASVLYLLLVVVSVCVCVTDAICSEISSRILCSRWDLCLQQTHTYTQCQPLAIPVDTLTHTCMGRCHVGQLACIYVRLDGSGGEAVVCMCTFLWILAELNCWPLTYGADYLHTVCTGNTHTHPQILF